MPSESPIRRTPTWHGRNSKRPSYQPPPQTERHRHDDRIERLRKAEDDENFNRLHPRSHIGKARVPAEPDLAGNDPPYRERYTPDLRDYERVRDADGRVRGERRYEPGNEPETIVAAWLLEEARRLIEMARERGRKVPKGRRDTTL